MCARLAMLLLLPFPPAAITMIMSPCAEPAWSSKPADAIAATDQATSALVVALPLAMSTSLSWPKGVPASSDMTVTSELLAALAAGKQLWQQQASSADLLTCTAYNGPGQLLKDAAPVVGDQSQAGSPGLQRQHARTSLASAHAAFASMAKAIAVEAAARHRSSSGSSADGGSRRGSSDSSDWALEKFRRAVVLPTDPVGAEPVNGVLPPPSVDAQAYVQWAGGSSMSVNMAAGQNMSAAELRLANHALQDNMFNLVPWLQVQVGVAVSMSSGK